MVTGSIIKINLDVETLKLRSGMIGLVYHVTNNTNIDFSHKSSNIIFENGSYDNFTSQEISEYEIETIGHCYQLTGCKIRNINEVIAAYNDKKSVIGYFFEKLERAKKHIGVIAASELMESDDKFRSVIKSFYKKPPR